MSDNSKPGSTPGLARRLGDLVLDCSALGGAALITWGVHLIYYPAGFIAGGAFLLGGAWLAARKAA